MGLSAWIKKIRKRIARWLVKGMDTPQQSAGRPLDDLRSGKSDRLGQRGRIGSGGERQEHVRRGTGGASGTNSESGLRGAGGASGTSGVGEAVVGKRRVRWGRVLP
ncbi:hypothetical protein CF651_27220, partial [Paenibacillus rigui]